GMTYFRILGLANAGLLFLGLCFCGGKTGFFAFLLELFLFLACPAFFLKCFLCLDARQVGCAPASVGLLGFLVCKLGCRQFRFRLRLALALGCRCAGLGLFLKCLALFFCGKARFFGSLVFGFDRSGN